MDDGIKTFNLYDGKIEVKFYGPTEDKPNRHLYYVNGKRKGSVTGALNMIDKSGALVGWAVGLYSEYLEQNKGKKITDLIIAEGEQQHEIAKTKAAGIGTEAHDWIEKFVKGEEPPMPENQSVLQAVNGFLDWVEENDVKFKEAEKVVYSKKHDYIGTMDAVATLNGGRKRYVIDYKVSSGLYPSVAYQTASYAKADEEETGKPHAGRWAIRLLKESEDEYYQNQEKKLKRWQRKNPSKEPYEITPYQPFEARFLDDDYMRVDRDYKAFLKILEFSKLHREVDQEFFSKR